MIIRKTHSAASRAQALKQVLREDKALAQIAAKYGIHPNQISHWKANALQGLTSIFERGDGAQAAEKAAHKKQTKKLYEQIGWLTTHLAWSKNDFLYKSGLAPEQVGATGVSGTRVPRRCAFGPGRVADRVSRQRVLPTHHAFRKGTSSEASQRRDLQAHPFYGSRCITPMEPMPAS